MQFLNSAGNCYVAFLHIIAIITKIENPTTVLFYPTFYIYTIFFNCNSLVISGGCKLTCSPVLLFTISARRPSVSIHPPPCRKASCGSGSRNFDFCFFIFDITYLSHRSFNQARLIFNNLVPLVSNIFFSFSEIRATSDCFAFQSKTHYSGNKNQIFQKNFISFHITTYEF